MMPSTRSAAIVLNKVLFSADIEPSNTMTGVIDMEFVGKKRALRVLIDSRVELNFIS